MGQYSPVIPQEFWECMHQITQECAGYFVKSAGHSSIFFPPLQIAIGLIASPLDWCYQDHPRFWYNYFTSSLELTETVQCGFLWWPLVSDSAQDHYKMKNQLLLEPEVVKYLFGWGMPLGTILEPTATWRTSSLELAETVQCGFLRWPTALRTTIKYKPSSQRC